MAAGQHTPPNVGLKQWSAWSMSVRHLSNPGPQELEQVGGKPMHSESLTRPKRLRADILLRERSLNLISLARTTAARAANTTLWLNMCSSFVGRDCDEMGNHERKP